MLHACTRSVDHVGRTPSNLSPALNDQVQEDAPSIADQLLVTKYFSLPSEIIRYHS